MNESKAMSNILAEIYKNAGFKDLDVSLKSIFQKWQEKYQNTEKFSGLQQAIKTIEEFAYDYWYNNLVVAIPAELLPPGKNLALYTLARK
ncbi:MAG: hypothetical protein HWD59_00725 [Coxiellaceae bacterium]|nr:MAG: hypothetical protein HWD59_00725 [Coxiellaceae bacterium]